jgi:serine/threonine protein kinase/Leucine-rich repeat (LRR) protein
MPLTRLEIVIRKPDASLGRYLLPPGEYLVGRDESCDVQIESPDVSRRHARLVVEQESCRIEDLGSRGGTWLNNERILQATSFTLPKSVRLGSSVLDFQVMPEQDWAAFTKSVEPKPSASAPGSPLEPELPNCLKGIRQLRNYVVRREVGHGGMGAVLEAQDLILDRAVAMKVILPERQSSEETYQRFIQEAKVLGKLEHPNIVPIHDLGLDELGRVSYTMKLVRGVTLQRVLDEIRHGNSETLAKYPLSQLLTIFQKVCDAVAFAHSKGVLHRDLKPENIMIGEFGEVQVMDWGLAKIIGAISPEADAAIPDNPARVARSGAEGVLCTLDGQVMGSPHFMAPEQAAGRVESIDERTDIYALGGILYSMLTLHPPIETKRDLEQMLREILRGKIRPPSEFNSAVQVAADAPESEAPVAKGLRHCPGKKVPPALAAVAMKALATHPAERYQHVADLQLDIAAYQSGFVTSAEQPNLFRLARLWIRRHRVAFGVIAGFTVLAVVSAVVVLKMWLELRGTARTFYEKSQVLLEAGQFKEALPPLEYAIRLEPGKADYRYLRGNIEQSLLDLENAKDSYKAALRAERQHNGAQENLLLCERLLGSVPRQGELPTSVLSELQLAMLSQGRTGEAHLMLKRLLAKDSDARNEFYRTWKAVLDRAGLAGAFTVGETGRVELTLSGAAVKDLSALKGMPLNRLVLDQTRVADLSPLKGLPLDSLDLLYGEVTDLSPLKGMKLKALALSCTRISDLSPLVGMPIEILYSGNNLVRDLRPLAGMPLKELLFGGLKVRDFGALAGLPLERLDLSTTALSDLRVLSGMPLHTLRAIDTEVSDLAPLSNLPLAELTLTRTKVKDLTPLKGLPLRILQLSDTAVSDLRPLAGMPLTQLELDGTLVKDLLPLKGLPITWLRLDATAVTNLQPLAGMSFRWLSLGRTRTLDLSPLRGMTINDLLLSYSSIVDLSPLSEMDVANLWLDHTKISDLRPLEGRPLKNLYLEGCPEVRDLKPLGGCVQLECVKIPVGATNVEVLRRLPNLEHLAYSGPPGDPTRILAASEFWKRYDARASTR